MKRLVPIGIVLFASLPGRAVNAQALRGVIQDATSGEPIAAALVAVTGTAADMKRTLTLSNEDGQFTISVSAGGLVRVRVERIGYTAIDTAFAEIPIFARIILRPTAISVDAIQVTATRRCTIRPDRAAEMTDVWAAARAALEVVRVSQAERRFVYETAHYRRVLDPDTRTRRTEERWTSIGRGESPFLTLPPDSLVRAGFAQPNGRGFTYYGPDASVLLSDEFLDSYCFELRTHPDSSNWIGLGFRQNDRHEAVGIVGTLWIDRRTSRLGIAEFTYTNAGGRAPPGGRIEFEQLANGFWIVSKWSLWAPGTSSRGEPELHESGGAVIQVRSARVAAEQSARTVSGIVFDPGSGTTVPGAHVYVSGASISTTADSTGRFELDEVPASEVVIAFEHRATSRFGQSKLPRQSEEGGDKFLVILANSNSEAVDSAGLYYKLGKKLLAEPATRGVGAALYLRGLSASAGHVDGYFRDLSPILFADEIAEFNVLQEPAAQRDWIHTFWKRLSALNGGTPIELVGEHFARISEARARYMAPGRRGAESSTTLPHDTADFRLDHRGLIFVRHGEPDKVISSSGPSILPNETWVYESPRRILHFVARTGDFRLTDNILTAFEHYPSDVQRDLIDVLASREAAAPLVRLLDDRAAADPLLSPLRQDFEILQQQVLSSLRRGVRLDQIRFSMSQANSPTAEYHRRLVDSGSKIAAVTTQMLSTRDPAPKFTDEVPFHFDVYRFRGTGGQVQLTAAVAVPGSEVAPDTTPSFLLYAPRILFSAADPGNTSTVVKDTTLYLRSARVLTANEYINTFIQVGSDADSAHFRISVRDATRPGAGQTYGGSLPLSDIRHDPAISDIVFATTRAGRWKRGAAALEPIPPAQIARDSAFRIFYEVYGLPQGERYETELIIEQREKGRGLPGVRSLLRRRDRVAMRFSGETSSAEAIQELRTIGGGLVPGKYVLSIRIRAVSSGRTIQRERLFQVN